ncbi:MAG: 4Fe-4S dicluster domain-containing protein, partial [Myxococcota bacterium]
ASFDNRPFKIEPNPAHPFSKGGTDAYAQASILTMFDPDRSQKVFNKDSAQDDRKAFDDALKTLSKSALSSQGNGVRFLTGSNSSPTIAALRDEILAKMPQAKWVEYESLSRDNERVGSELAFGQRVKTHYHLDKAEVIVSLGGDLLGDHPAKLKHARDWADGRRPEEGKMNRLYVVEPRYTATGVAADHRLPVRAEQILPFALALESAIKGKPGSQGFLGDEKVQKMLKAIADDLKHHKGHAVVATGHHADPAVHAVVHRINQALGNAGHTVTYTEDKSLARPSHGDALKALAKEMTGGQVKTLFILGGNPAYDAPGDIDFAAAMDKVANTVHVGLYRDKTAKKATWHVPLSHFLECWGDATTWDGLVSIQQPLMAPLYPSISIIQLLTALVGKTTTEDEAVRMTALKPKETATGPASMSADSIKAVLATAPEPVEPATAGVSEGPQFAPTEDVELQQARKTLPLFLGESMDWRKWVAQGFIPNTTDAAVTPVLRAFAEPKVDARAYKPGSELANGDLEVMFYDDGKVHDGRFANNGWLQETPDFTTKLTWDNAAIMSPATAKLLGVTDRDMATVSVSGKSVDLPVYIMPGQATGSIAVAVGYGRPEAGAVGGGTYWQVDTTGFDVQPLRTASSPYRSLGASVAKTGSTYKLATTQAHWAIDTAGLQEMMGRVPELVRAGTLDEYKSNPEFAPHKVHHPKLLSLFPEFEWKEGYQWGMAIDLGKCTGCNACVVSCTSENNVPIVGKDQVLLGREMHWLRIDRYFTGEDAEDPEIATQPVACVHCQNAPCEQVCPVAATVHDEEGTNNMVYNRCIGTRYCANNCPYKVRRFNYYNYHNDLAEPENYVKQMAHNPDVTVRFRGVMEKCSYCMQRIHAAKTEARKDGRRQVRDGEIKSACQTACPTNAITFGN